jgi:hypothetical protein
MNKTKQKLVQIQTRIYLYVNSKIFDPEMSPLGFDMKKMYNFIATRFNNSNATTEVQALNWLQMLTILEITIPLSHLFAMFNDGTSINENIILCQNNDFNIEAMSNEAKDIKDSRIRKYNIIYIKYFSLFLNIKTVMESFCADNQIFSSCHVRYCISFQVKQKSENNLNNYNKFSIKN